ncbi:MAG: exosortase A [Nitrosomonas sp.]|jgi:exosortase A|nr:exosortase A [Nitrosomonas sp.]
MNSSISSESLGKTPVSMAVLLTVLAITAILLIYHQTTWSMIATWHRSETYAHGFLILPFVVYMIWVKRHSIGMVKQQPSPTALIGLCVLGFLWLVAELASVQVVTQYALVAMLPLIVAVILGYKVMFTMTFPLTYLFFAVPFGDILIPPLINFTADFTVWALQLSGIPVYREGTYFSLPTGNWSVVEACSGLRYLIASVTLGTLYAYLTYRSLNRRIIFIALSIIIPIIANAVRAYLIVMTGHLSDMTIAVGVDHLIYGWIFFGLVMLVLFWIGAYWREDVEGKADIYQEQMKPDMAGNGAATIRATIYASSAAIAIGLIWPTYAAYLNSDLERGGHVSFNLILPKNNWQASEEHVSNWEPVYVGNPEKFSQHYVNQKNDHVSLFIAYYSIQRQGDELISSGNILVPELDQTWRIINETKVSVNTGLRNIEVRQTQLKSPVTNLLVWRWYMLNENEETASPYIAKMILAKNKLLTAEEGGAEIIITAPYNVDPDEAKPVLEQFLTDILPGISSGFKKLSSSDT